MEKEKEGNICRNRNFVMGQGKNVKERKRRRRGERKSRKRVRGVPCAGSAFLDNDFGRFGLRSEARSPKKEFQRVRRSTKE